MKSKSEHHPPEYKGMIEREFTLLNSEKGEEHEKDQAQSNTPSISNIFANLSGL